MTVTPLRKPPEPPTEEAPEEQPFVPSATSLVNPDQAAIRAEGAVWLAAQQLHRLVHGAWTTSTGGNLAGSIAILERRLAEFKRSLV